MAKRYVNLNDFLSSHLHDNKQMPKIKTGEQAFVSKCEYCDKIFNSKSHKTILALERMHHKVNHSHLPLALSVPDVNDTDYLRAEYKEKDTKQVLTSADLKTFFDTQKYYKE